MKSAIEQVVLGQHTTTTQQMQSTSNALDLSQIISPSVGAINRYQQQPHNSNGEDEGFDDTRSEEFDSDAEEEIEFEYSQNSNPSSPLGLGSNSNQSNRGSIINSNSKRFRTQMTTVMLKAMKSIFADYKTPTMAECESLGREIGLPKRVVQVWFQNARAKEKKARMQFAKTFGQDFDSNPPIIEDCKICNVKYNYKISSNAMQEHLFSSAHIAKLKNHINNLKKIIEGQEDNSADFPVASGHPIPPTMLVNPHSTTSMFNNNNNNSPADPKKAVSFMQQLQLIQGLAAASQQGTPSAAGTIPLNLNDLLNGATNESHHLNGSSSSNNGEFHHFHSSPSESENNSPIEQNISSFMFATNAASLINSTGNSKVSGNLMSQSLFKDTAS